MHKHFRYSVHLHKTRLSSYNEHHKYEPRFFSCYLANNQRRHFCWGLVRRFAVVFLSRQVEAIVWHCLLDDCRIQNERIGRYFGQLFLVIKKNRKASCQLVIIVFLHTVFSSIHYVIWRWSHNIWIDLKNMKIVGSMLLKLFISS